MSGEMREDHESKGSPRAEQPAAKIGVPSWGEPAAPEDVAAQEEKPVLESASPVREDARVEQGPARAADPKNADDVLTRRMPHDTAAAAERNAADAAVLAESRRHTRRAFVGFAAGAAAAYGFRRYLAHGPRDEMISGLLHKNYAWNADVAREVLPRHALAPTFSLRRAETLRVNGVFGLKKMLVPESYRLQVVGVRNATASPHFVPDVTAWNYTYDDTATHEDQGHDTKTDPSNMSSPKMAPEGMQAKAEEDENHTGASRVGWRRPVKATRRYGPARPVCCCAWKTSSQSYSGMSLSCSSNASRAGARSCNGRASALQISSRCFRRN